MKAILLKVVIIQIIGTVFVEIRFQFAYFHYNVFCVFISASVWFILVFFFRLI